MRSGWGSFHVGARVGTVGSNVPLGRCAMLVHGCSERQRRSGRRFIINSMVFCLSRSRDRETTLRTFAYETGTERGVKPHRGRLSSCFFMCHDVTIRCAQATALVWASSTSTLFSAILLNTGTGPTVRSRATRVGYDNRKDDGRERLHGEGLLV